MTKRRETRIPLRLPVSIERRTAALSADVSSQGFCLEASQQGYAKGQVVDGYVLLGDKELPFKGTVAWVEPPSPMASPWGRLGVRFTRVSPGLRALLSIEQRRATTTK